MGSKGVSKDRAVLTWIFSSWFSLSVKASTLTNFATYTRSPQFKPDFKFRARYRSDSPPDKTLAICPDIIRTTILLLYIWGTHRVRVAFTCMNKAGRSPKHASPPSFIFFFSPPPPPPWWGYFLPQYKCQEMDPTAPTPPSIREKEGRGKITRLRLGGPFSCAEGTQGMERRIGVSPPSPIEREVFDPEKRGWERHEEEEELN